MATPEVAGAAALVKQFLPNATAYEVKRLLESTADDIGAPGFDRETGYGRINLKKLVDKVSDVLSGAATLDQGGTALVNVTTLNKYDADSDGTVTSAGDHPFPLPAVDVSLFKDGKLAYVAKTDYHGVATFTSIAPGDYQVMVSGQDMTDGNSYDFWPYERVSWDADGDAGNGVTMGDLTVHPGPNNNLSTPDEINSTLDSTMRVTLKWTGGGDLDLAIGEYDPASGNTVWSTTKTGGLWGTFSTDDTGSDTAHASETYTLNDAHYPSPAGDWYNISIDASNATVGTTATLTIEVNGHTYSYGPLPITPGSTAGSNLWYIYDALYDAMQNFDNMPCIY